MYININSFITFNLFLFIVCLWLIINKQFEKDFWYDVETDMWFPKCHKCKGKRDGACPKSCLGDIS